MKIYILSIAALLTTIVVTVPVDMKGKCSSKPPTLKQTNLQQTVLSVTSIATIGADVLYCKFDCLEHTAAISLQARQC